MIRFYAAFPGKKHGSHSGGGQRRKKLLQGELKKCFSPLRKHS